VVAAKPDEFGNITYQKNGKSITITVTEYRKRGL
jgi:hypothetical protein